MTNCKSDVSLLGIASSKIDEIFEPSGTQRNKDAGVVVPSKKKNLKVEPSLIMQ